MMFSKGRDMCKENEVLWMLYGIWIFDNFFGFKKFYRRGDKASVDFKWQKGMNPLVLGWMHSHPDGYGLNPSETDDKTMRSWVRAKNKPMVSAIYWMREEMWYLYFRDPDRNIRKTLLEVKYFGNFVMGFRKNKKDRGVFA
jgi:hypothetical protein